MAMERLPEEILVDVLDYLDPGDLIAAQKTCTSLSKSARANSLWRYKCFEKSPSASLRGYAGTVSNLTTALQGLTISERSPPTEVKTNRQDRFIETDSLIRESPRARAVNRWDLSARDERVDWYSEYKARHAPLRTDWLVTPDPSRQVEIKGIATLGESGRAVGFLEDASVCVWDLRESASGKRVFGELGRSAPDVLFSDIVTAGESLVTDCVSAFDSQQKAYIALGNVLNEVDLDTLRVVSHSKYAFPITALSQSTSSDSPLTVGTQWSLHILDPRIPVTPASSPTHERVDEVPAVSGDWTAILPNMSEDSFDNPDSSSANPGPSIWAPGSPSWRPSRRLQDPRWMTYARVEPGPLSIVHHAENEILLGGRFPSILSYDRRYFPRLQYVIHSSGSLSSLATIPHPPAGASSDVVGTSTLVACGEYRGRGSLELYSLPHVRPGQTSIVGGATMDDNASNDDTASPGTLFSYKNRQEAAKSKLLSVASHGTKIVFSDSEGGLKWVERDGRGLVRKWNINDFQVAEGGASVTGDQVARKIIPLGAPDSGHGQRGDADLLLWTGERVGVVTTDPHVEDHEELVNELERGEDAGAREHREKEEAYFRTMRRAFEREADVQWWISRFRLKRRNF